MAKLTAEKKEKLIHLNAKIKESHYEMIKKLGGGFVARGIRIILESNEKEMKKAIKEQKGK